MTFSGQTAGGTAPIADSIAAAMAWWGDAGVDHDYSDTPRSWIKPPEAAVAAVRPAALVADAPPPPAVRFGGDPADWPQALADFPAWWLAEPLLDGGHVGPRLPPRGSAGAQLMVLTTHPEAEDADRLLSGPQGRLLDAILAALKIAPNAAYVASALPRHMPMPDWAALGEAGLGELLAHHVRLAAPKRLLVFGSHVSSLLGHDPANSTGFLRIFHHEEPNLPVLVAPGLEMLAARPRGKARLWQALLDWQSA